MRFPASLAELTDPHLCPRCFTTLHSTEVCDACEFPIGDERNARVLELSRSAADALTQRGVLVRNMWMEAMFERAADVRMRAEQARADAELAEADRLRAETDARMRAEQEYAERELAARMQAEAEQAQRRRAEAELAERVRPATISPQPAGSGPGHIARPAAPVLDQTPPATTPRKGSALQMILLVLGVSLLAIAAGFFLVYAWFTFDLVARAVTTVAMTLAAVVGASWLRRAQLKAAAEGVASLGAILIGLDAWAVPAVGLFGLDRIDPALYWGVALIVLAVVFEGWSRVSALRLPAVAASLAVVPGAGLLAAGIAGLATDGPTRFAIGAVGATAGALIHLAWRRRNVAVEPSTRRRVLPFQAVLRQAAAMDRTPEIIIVVIAGALASVAGLFTLSLPIASETLDPLRTMLFAALALTAIAQAILLPRHREPAWLGTLASVFAPIGVLAALAAPLALVNTSTPDEVWAAISAAVAVTAPVLIERLRMHSGAFTTPAPTADAAFVVPSPTASIAMHHRRAAMTAALITSLVALAPLAIASLLLNTRAVRSFMMLVAQPGDADRTGVFDEASNPQAVGITIGLVAGLAIIALVTIGASVLRRRVEPWWVVAALVAIMLGAWQIDHAIAAHAVLIAGFGAVIAGLWLTRGGSADATAVRSRRDTRIVLWSGLGALAAHLIAIGNLHPGHLTVSVFVVSAGLLAARLAAPVSNQASVVVRPLLTGVAAVVLVAGAIRLPPSWSRLLDIELAGAASTAVLLAGAVLIGLVALLPRRVVSRVEIIVLFATAALPAVIAGIVAVGMHASAAARWPVGPVSQPLLLLVTATLFAIAVVVAIGRRGGFEHVGGPGPERESRPFEPARLLLTVAPLVAWVPMQLAAVWATSSFGVDPWVVTQITFAASGVLAAGASLVVRARSGRGTVMWLSDAPALVIAFVAWFSAIGTGADDLAITAVLAAATTVLVGSSADGLVRSISNRRDVAWIAIPFAVTGWLAFADMLTDHPTAELRWLPSGAIVAAAGLFVWFGSAARRDGRRAYAGPWVFAGGLQIAALPIAVAGALDDAPPRSLIVMAAAAVALIASTVTAWPRAIIDLALPTAVAASGVLTFAALVQAVAEPIRTNALTTVVWVAPMVAVVAIACVLAARSGLLGTDDRTANVALGVMSWVGGLVTATALLQILSGSGMLDVAATGTALVVIATGLARITAMRAAAAVLAPMGAMTAFASMAQATHPEGGLDADATSLWMALLLTLAVAALAATIVRLRNEHAGWRAASMLSLPLLAWALVASLGALPSVRSIESVGGASGAVPIAGAGLVALATVLIGAVLARGGSVARSADRRVLDGAAVVLALGGTAATPMKPVTALLVGAVLVTASASVGVHTDAAAGVERTLRRIARFVSLPVLLTASAATLGDWWPEAPRAMFAVVPGVVLMLVGVLAAFELRRRRPTDQPGRASIEATIELAIGAGIALVGAVLVEPFADSARATHLVVSALAVVLLLVWAVRPLPAAASAYAVAVAGPAAVALGAVPILRTVGASVDPLTAAGSVSSVAAELWGLPIVAALLGIAGIAAVRAPRTPDGAVDRFADHGVPLLDALPVLAAATAAITPMMAMLLGSDDDAGAMWWRGPLWLTVLITLACVAFARGRTPFGQPLFIAALTGTGLLALLTLGSGSFDRIEQLTVPIGAGLFAIGAIHLRRSPRARSWPFLGTAVGVLLVPSYFAQFVDDPLWRIAGVGLVAVASLSWGLAARLQAPFLLGLAMTVMQAITAFWIALDQSNREMPWWIWLAAAGLLLLVLAIRFEASMRDARKTVTTIASMR